MKILVILTTVIISLIFTSTVEAKVLPQAAKSGKSITVKSTGTTIGVSPKLRADKKALRVYFSNLQTVSAVSYLLIYKTNGQEEGAMGGLNLTGGSSQNQELLFGTCSKNVCRYHTNIKDARLEVSYTTKAGKKYLKKFRIKI